MNRTSPVAEKSIGHAFEPLSVHWRDIWQERGPVRQLTLTGATFDKKLTIRPEQLSPRVIVATR